METKKILYQSGSVACNALVLLLGLVLLPITVIYKTLEILAPAAKKIAGAAIDGVENLVNACALFISQTGDVILNISENLNDKANKLLTK